MSVTLREVMAAARARAAGLAAEVAGYLVLGAADQVLGGPRALGPEDVALTDDGQVRVVAGRPGADAEAEAGLRRLLGQLLAHASSVTPALLRASSRDAGVGVQTLVHELEVALIPVNRAAGRRACARLHRDTVRAIEAGVLDGFETPEPLGAAPSPDPMRVSAPPAPPAAAVVAALPSAGETKCEVIDEWSLPVPVSPPAPAALVDASWMSPSVSEVMQCDSDIFEAAAHEASSPYMEVDWVDDEGDADLRAVPDLEVPPTPPPRYCATEPHADALTKPEPVVARREIDAARAHESVVKAADETPRLGSFAVCDVVSDPVVELCEADSTERMPAVEELTASPVDVLDALPVEGNATRDAESKAVPLEASASFDEELVAPPMEESAESAVEELPESIDEPEPLPAPEDAVEENSTEGLVGPDELAVADVPPRPALERRYAPPRFASRKSDVDDLLSRFSVESVSADTELCRDLKSMAGVDATAIPPSVAIDATPPPVEVDEGERKPSREPNRASARWLVGALGVLLMVGAAGSTSLPPRMPPGLEAVAAAAAPQLGEAVAQVAEPACTAEIRVKRVQPGDRVTLTAGPARRTWRAKVSGQLAAFDALPCGEAVEVTVGSSRRGRWSTIPVTAARLTPSPGASRVRVTLLAR